MIPNLDAVKKTFVAGALILSQTVWLSAMPAFADGEVRLAGQPIFSLPAGATVTSDSVQNNLDNALVAAKDRTASSVSIVYAKGMPVITLGGFQVVTIDSATASAANLSPALLANKWADGLKSSLQDQNSVNSYVSQLSAGASAVNSAPAVASAGSAAPPSGAPYEAGQAAPPAQAAYQPPQGGVYQPVQYTPGAAAGGTYAQTPPPQYGAPPAYGAPGYGQPPQYGQAAYGAPPYGAPGGYRQGRVAYAPAGLVMPLSLQTSISTQVAKSGDMVQAQINEPINLGDSIIPTGSTVLGVISEAEAGKRLSRSGSLTIKFNRLRTPDGVETPISGHLIGGIAKYTENASGELRGEGWKAKVGQTAIRTGAGAGIGAALGTAVGAIAGRGYGAGMGAWSGAAIGGGVGAGDMLLRKGRDVTIPSGTSMQLQLDAPATIAGGGQTGNL